MDSRIRAVLFDLDGTLIDTAGEIEAALGSTFDEIGIPRLASHEVVALIGRGVHALVSRALEKQGAASVDVDLAVERFEHRYAALVGTSAIPFPGVMEGLRELRVQGLKLAAVTNKPRLFTMRLLEKNGIASMMSAVVAGDDGLRRKPAGDMLLSACTHMGTRPEETLMLGDSENDVIAARAAGCPVWCVPYGYTEGRPPDTLQCDRLVATIHAAAQLILAA
jgi:phosphoglycolate phosphatase